VSIQLTGPSGRFESPTAHDGVADPDTVGCLARKFLGLGRPSRKASKSLCFQGLFVSGSASCARQNPPVFNRKTHRVREAPFGTARRASNRSPDRRGSSRSGSLAGERLGVPEVPQPRHPPTAKWRSRCGWIVVCHAAWDKAMQLTKPLAKTPRKKVQKTSD